MNYVEREIARLAVIFDARPISPEKIAMYVERLSDMPEHRLHAAVDVLIDTEKEAWLPTPGRIKDVAAELGELSPMMSAAESLEWCTAELNRFGRKDGPPDVWPDPITQEAMRQFGWERFTTSHMDYLPAQWEKAHRQAREDIKKRVLTGDMTALPGLTVAELEAGRDLMQSLRKSQVTA